ncbi:MAG: molybdopterin converting factor subunit 1 [Rhodospirillales bacterium]|nr:molybdopterin converting factor subunit 1 [Rhodospirillales bacterium]
MKLVYFSWLREKAGLSEEEVELPPAVGDVRDLLDWQRERGGGFAEAFADLASVRVAVNQEHVTLDHAVKAGDEIAFFPPVTGGRP